MQRNVRTWMVVLSVMLLTLVLGACTGGGTSGKTWFNLPAAAIKIQPNGTANAYGIPINQVVLPPATIQQLQAANVQQAEVRWGYNGAHVYLNGEDLPYLAWDEASQAKLGEVLKASGAVPSADFIARYLPWLRKVGWGVKLELPVATGSSALTIPRWRGETSVTPVEVSEPTIGPLNLNNISFDDQGNAKVGPIPTAALGAPVTLPPNVLAMVQALGIDTATLQTQIDGLHTTLDADALPTLAWDPDYMARTVAWAEALAPGNPSVDTFASIAPQLPGADVTVAVSFTGEPVGQLDLSNLNVGINPDGSVRALGLDIPGGSLVPADTMALLQNANIQHLDLNLGDSGVVVGVNGQALPAINWTPAGLGVVSTLATSLGGIPAEQIDGILQLVGETGVGLQLDVPPADGAEAVTADRVTEATFAPVDLGAFAAPVIRAALAVDGNGVVQQIGNISAGTLGSVGVPPIALPSNVVDLLSGLGASNVALQTGNGTAEVKLDGEMALSLQYDAASLATLLNLVKPLANIEALNDPNLSKIIEEQILPLVPGAQLDVSVDLQ